MYKLNLDFNDKEWDEFVEKSKNGTLFHTRKFLSYHGSKFDDCSFTITKKNNIIACFPAVVQMDNIVSHAGSSFGGFVLSKDIGLKDVHKCVDMLCKYAKQNKIHKIQMRLPPTIYHILPSEELDFVLTKFGFKNVSSDLCSCIDLTNDFNFTKSVKRNINKNVKAVMKANNADLHKFWIILEKNLKDRHNVKPTHSILEIEKLAKMFPTKIQLLGGYLDNILVAGVVLFRGNDNGTEVFYIAQDYDYQKYRILSMLLAETAGILKATGYHYMNLGVSTEHSGSIINWGLFKFKEGFGARGVLRRTYEKEIMPI